MASERLPRTFLSLPAFAMALFVLPAHLSGQLEGKRILIYGPTLSDFFEPNEQTIASDLHAEVVVASAAEWGSYRWLDFIAYDAIIIPDPNGHYACDPLETLYDTAEATKSEWSRAITPVLY